MNFKKILNKTIDPNSFCVVGNGPMEIGKKNGIHIDSFNSVIRFNDFSILFPNDYGTKTDIWVRATNDEVIETVKEKNKQNFKMIFIRSKNEKNKESIKFLNENSKYYEIFPTEYEKNLSKLLKSIPSTGLLFLYILSENGYKITKKNVFGFSFFDEKDIEKYGNHHYYFVKSGKKSKGIVLAKHNWKKEKKLYETILKERNVK